MVFLWQKGRVVVVASCCLDMLRNLLFLVIL